MIYILLVLYCFATSPVIATEEIKQDTTSSSTFNSLTTTLFTIKPTLNFDPSEYKSNIYVRINTNTHMATLFISQDGENFDSIVIKIKDIPSIAILLQKIYTQAYIGCISDPFGIDSVYVDFIKGDKLIDVESLTQTSAPHHP